jgi:hypothetical protein
MRKIKVTKRRLPMVLLAIAAGLTAWIFELGAVLMRRRSAFLAPVAAMTATAFGLDAWFDVMTALPGSSWYESLAAAFLGEVPMTVVLAGIAWLAASQGTVGRSRTARAQHPRIP